MYAVIKSGGKQYRVSEGDTIEVEKLDGKPGDTVELGQVLLVVDGEKFVLGRPVVEGAKVAAQIVDQDKHRKLIVFKYKKRKRYRRKTGHRQPFTALKITGIAADLGVAPDPQPAAPEAQPEGQAEG